MQFDNGFLLGLLVAPGALVLLILMFRLLCVSNPEGHELLALRFGKLRARQVAPGLIGPVRLIPYDSWISVSRQWDERVFRGIESNDSQGTSVQVDLRVTFRIVDGEKALFAVDNWEEALESTTVHEAAAELAGKRRADFLHCSPELSTALTISVKANMAAYGIEVQEVRIMNVQFRLEVSRQMFEAVAAKLEVATAEYEERGRTDAALLLGRTEQQVAELEARAKTESLKAVGRAYREMRARPEIFRAYTELYRLSQLDPARVVSFEGFSDGELSSAALAESDLELDGDNGQSQGKPTNGGAHG